MLKLFLHNLQFCQMSSTLNHGTLKQGFDNLVEMLNYGCIDHSIICYQLLSIVNFINSSLITPDLRLFRVSYTPQHWNIDREPKLLNEKAGERKPCYRIESPNLAKRLKQVSFQWNIPLSHLSLTNVQNKVNPIEYSRTAL